MQIARLLKATLGAALLLWTMSSLQAQVSAGLDGIGRAANEVEFLPVEEAYQLLPSVASDRVLLDWTIAPGYFLYRERMKIEATTSDGKPLSIMLAMRTGESKYDEYFERDTEIYHHQTQVVVTFAAPPAQPFTIAVESQGCAEAGLCYPPQQQFVRIDLAAGTAELLDGAPVIAAPANVQPSLPDTPAAHIAPNLSMVFLMALLGGLILNLMPCVFPVLSLKVFAMAAQRERDDEAHLHSWIYAAGVVVSFVAVASVMLLLRAGGEAVGWGFQLQEPLFISLLVYLFFILGLSFSGVVHIGGSLMGIGQNLVAGSPVKGAFFTGVLAVVVASPCSVPFMGVALGFAVSQSAPLALLVFAILGLGMALPFILLAYWPQMLHNLPAPGPWMERLRQFLAFPLYATGVWLLWVLGQQGGQMAMVAVLGGLILLVMAGWLWRDASARVWEKGLAITVLLTALVVPHFLVVETCRIQQQSVFETGDAEPYSAARLVELRAAGKPVFINMTAAWCLTCLVNEKVALGRDSVKQTLRDKGITYLKGDWTNRDPEITSFLQQFERNGVPLYLYFPPGRGGEIVILPQVLTENSVLEALR
ncbi:MAG TPA: protein-disulfide reductase DsbD [Pseudomonadales bacterium]|nr:protein-disulfide reductase DsbD [Pseudomonadales bacterium]